MVRLLLFVRLLLYRCDRAWVSIIRCPIRNQIAFCAQRITIIASTRHSKSADRNNGIRKNTWRQRVVLVTYQLENWGNVQNIIPSMMLKCLWVSRTDFDLAFTFRGWTVRGISTINRRLDKFSSSLLYQPYVCILYIYFRTNVPS